jgi:outer membrane receptor protein involved in Fe transport
MMAAPRGRRQRLLAVSVMASAPWFLGIATARADAETGQPATAKPEEIVVTASRNGAANVQNVPIAVSVIRPDALESFGGSGLEDFTQMVPSLSMQEDGPGINKINIRGIVTSGLDYTDVQDRPTVAVYLDETPISLQAQNPDLKVFDLSRVEVLRGPQGTLYGAGAMSGTIRLITQKPDLAKTSASLEEVVSDTTGGYGGLNYSLRGMVNIPLVKDKFALRAVFYHGDDSGFIDNVGLNKHTPHDISNQARVALRVKPDEKLTLDASVTYEYLNAAVYDGYGGLAPYQTQTLEPEGTKDHMLIYNFTGGYDLGFATATNSTSYLVRHNADLAANEYGVNAFLFTGQPLQPALDIVRNNTTDLIDEFRVTSTGNPRLSWNVGVFYEKFIRHYYQDQPATNFDSLWGPVVSYPGYSSLDDGAFQANDDFSGTQDVRERQIAVFGQATYKILPNLNLTAGLRYFDWHQDFNLYFGGVFGASPGSYGGVPGAPLQETGKAAAHGATPRIALDYHLTPGTMLFAEAAKGFRYGGVNQPVPLSICQTYLSQIGLSQAPLQFGPDSLWSYSAGEKSTLFNGGLTLNVSGFLINWNNVQTTRDLACSYYFIENKGKIQSRGLELEAGFKLTSRLTGSANASYTNSETQGTISNLNAPDGSPAPYTPKYILSLTGNYRIPFAHSELNLGMQYNYRSSQATTFNPVDYNYRTIPAQNRLNAEVTYNMGQWQIGLFGNNIGNWSKVVNVNAIIPGSQQPGDTVFYTRPMTVGLRLKNLF